MQTSLMFLDLKTKGLDLGLQKIAIKMPKGADGFNVDEFGEFSGIIGALMESMSTEQLQNSFQELEWVPVEGDGSGFAPLIDLSGKQGDTTLDMAKQLFDHGMHNRSQSPYNTTPSLHGAIHYKEDNPAPGKGLAETVRNGAVAVEKLASDDKNELQMLNLRHNQADLPKTATGELLADSNKGRWLDNEKHSTKGLDNEKHNFNGLDKDAVLSKNDGTKINLENITGRQGKETKAEFTERKDLPPVTNAHEGNHKQRTSENGIRMSSAENTQHQLNTQMASGQDTEQHFSGNKYEDAQLSLRQKTKVKAGSEGSNTNIKFSSSEAAVETPNDSSEQQPKGITESREGFQAHLSKSKTSFGKNVEFVSGGKEGNSSPQDVQSNAIRQIVQRMTLQTHGTQSSMTIKLKPEFLGNVQMQVSTDNQQVIVRMATDSMAVKEMIEQGLQHLKSELQQHGLEIDKFDVFVANDNDESKHSQDLAGFRQALKRQRRNGMKNNQRESEGDDSNTELEAKNKPSADRSSEIDYFA